MSSLSTHHVQQMDRLSSDFFEDGDGLRVVARRTLAVDDVVHGHFNEVFAGETQGVAAIAVGGYGRSEMFPHSDVDLLLLFERRKDVRRHKDRISTLLTQLWDSKLRVSHSVRDPRDCTSLAPDNTELHISLLDTRFVAGDRPFFENFQTTTLPKFYLREHRPLFRSLAETARKRHREFDQTLYHLEPNVKEGPGGLRDYHLACWVAQLENVHPRGIPASGDFLPGHRDWDIREAKRFLFALRCYLHYYFGRDKNLLTFDMQDSISHAGAGLVYNGAAGVSDLMRKFFRSTRAIYRLALRLMDESAAPTSTLLSLLRKRKSRLSNRNFSVTNGRIYFKHAHALETRPKLALELFQFQARHGIPLAAETETRIRDQLPYVREHFDSPSDHWSQLREILLLPHTYQALEAMRESGVLYGLLPDFELIDCLVIRDFYHRYTVDEHTLVTVRVLKDLPQATHAIDVRFAGLLREVERLDLLFCALLFHDVGKGADGSGHSLQSARIADSAMHRLGLTDQQDRDTVLFLVREHLAMSEVMTKRDLSESAVLEGFKARVKTLEMLKLLTLLTYADTVAVNPSVVTNWRKELLWRLYLGVYAVFQRDHEDYRIEAGIEEEILGLVDDPGERRQLKRFLRGLPERYLRVHTPEEILGHARLAAQLEPDVAAAVSNWHHGDLEFVVLAWERPFLFASLCAAIASFGFNIEHAEAFSNDDGLVLDSFRVTSARPRTRGTLDSKTLRGFEQRLGQVADGTLDVRQILKRRAPVSYRRRNAEPPQVSLDNETSARATIFYVQAPDRSGLLYDLSSVFSQHECEIDVVLCQTQGHRAVDVFYLRKSGEKLDADSCGKIRAELLDACEQGAVS